MPAWALCLEMLGKLAASCRLNRDRVAQFLRTHPELALLRDELQYKERLLSLFCPCPGWEGVRSRPTCAACSRPLQSLDLPWLQPGMDAELFLQPNIAQVPLALVMNLLEQAPHAPEMYATCSRACYTHLADYRQEIRRVLGRNVCVIQLTEDQVPGQEEFGQDEWRRFQVYPVYLICEAKCSSIKLPNWLQAEALLKTRYEGRLLLLVAIVRENWDPFHNTETSWPSLDMSP